MADKEDHKLEINSIENQCYISASSKTKTATSKTKGFFQNLLSGKWALPDPKINTTAYTSAAMGSCLIDSGELQKISVLQPNKQGVESECHNYAYSQFVNARSKGTIDPAAFIAGIMTPCTIVGGVTEYKNILATALAKNNVKSGKPTELASEDLTHGLSAIPLPSAKAGQELANK